MRSIPYGTVSPAAMIWSVWQHRLLIATMTKRALIARYKGSVMGVFWTLINPILMLSIYAFMFLFVFTPKWRVTSDAAGESSFVSILFTGLIVHAFIAEVIGSGPNIINSNVNFVKKIIFPLEILSVVSVAAAFVNCMVAWLVLVCMQSFIGGQMHLTMLLFPLILLPFAVLALGLSWAIASLGVFLRDISQVASFIVSAALFLSPIFFPVSALPQFLQFWIQLNPITFIVEQARKVMIYGELPDLTGGVIYSLVAFFVACAGFFMFQKLRKGFADVL